MNNKVARLLVGLYPRDWRKRYGAEFRELLISEPPGFRASADVVWSALREHIFPTRRNEKVGIETTMGFLLKRPAGFLPMAMSITAFFMTMAAVARSGIVRNPGEIIEHLWQILMTGQMPIILFFVIKWLPRAPRQTLYVLGQQMVAAGASFALVFFLGL